MPENKNKLELFTELYVDSQNIKLPVSVVVGVLLRVPNEGQISVVVGGASVIKVLLVNIELIFTQIIIILFFIITL